MVKETRGRLRAGHPLLITLLAAGAILGGVLGALAATRGRSRPNASGPRLQTTAVIRTNLSTTASFQGTIGFTAGRTLSDPAGGTVTALPAAGRTIGRGEPLYWVNDQPVIVFYGGTALFRTLRLPLADTRRGAAPEGPSPGVLAARQTLESARLQVTADELTLRQSELQRATTGRATLLQARAQLRTDTAALAAARRELEADQQLGCPAASPATVGSRALTGGPPSGTTGTGTSGSGARSARDTGSGSAGTQPGSTQPGATQPGATQPGATQPGATQPGATQPGGTVTTPAPVLPTVGGEQDSGETTTTALLTGEVTPGGSDTVYHFVYGTSSAFGRSTPNSDAGSGADPIQVSAQLTGLRPDTTYVYALVASNAYGSANGITESFTTATSSCAQQRQTIAGDEQAVAQDQLTVRGARASVSSTTETDREQLRADRAVVRTDIQALQQAQRDVAPPSTAQMHGLDVALVAQNLAALGYFSGATTGPDLAYTPALAAAVRRWQVAAGIDPTGALSPAQVVVLHGPARIAAVRGTVGGHATAPIVSLSGTTKVISFSGSGDLRPGQPVRVSAAGGVPVAGRITSVTPSGNRVLAQVRVSDPGLLPASGPVGITVTTQSRPDVLAVPVEALLARPSGGYALQLPGGYQLPVRVGLIAGDLAEVSGHGLRAGLRVVTAV